MEQIVHKNNSYNYCTICEKYVCKNVVHYESIGNMYHYYNNEYNNKEITHYNKCERCDKFAPDFHIKNFKLSNKLKICYNPGHNMEDEITGQIIYKKNTLILSETKDGKILQYRNDKTGGKDYLTPFEKSDICLLLYSNSLEE